MRLVVLLLAGALTAACGGDQGPEPMGPDPSNIGKANPLGAGGSSSGPASAGGLPAASGTTTEPTKSPTKKPTSEPTAPGQPAKTGDLSAEQADKLLARFLAILDSAATQLVAAKGNCGTIAKVLNGWVDKNGAEAKRIYTQLGAAQKHVEVMKKYGPKLQQTQATFGQATAPCAKDPTVEKAARRFILALQGRAG